MNEAEQWIGVDLDGTLAEYNDWIGIEHIGKAIPLMVERVRGWIAEGKKVKIFTARVTAGQKTIRYIHEWLVSNGLPELEVTNIKDFDMLELWDDRCVSVITNTGMPRFNAAIRDSAKTTQDIYRGNKTVTDVPTGFKVLDELTSGLHKGNLIVIGGRTRMGNISVELNIARNVALSSQIPVAIFDLKNTKEQLVKHLICMEAKIDSRRIRKGLIRENEWQNLTSAASKISEAPIFINEASAITVSEIKSSAGILKADKGLDLIIINDLQCLRSNSPGMKGKKQISVICSALKDLAMELNIPVVVFSQLKRQSGNRADKRPMMADIPNSKAIKEIADVVMFIKY